MDISIFWLKIIVLVYAMILSSLHLFYDKLPNFIINSHVKILSYGGGSLLGIIFLVFMPETVYLNPTTRVYPLMLLGYVIFFLSEKYLYQHVKNPRILEEELYYLHSIGFFIDHFIKGFILITVIELDPILGLLTAIPFFIHTLSASIALKEIHKICEREIDKTILSSSTTIGALSGMFFPMNPSLRKTILAFVLGMMLFMVSRDILPRKKEGKPKYFILGVTTILLIWLIIENISKSI